MKMAIIALAACTMCAICAAACGRDAAIAPAKRNELKLMSINVWSGLDYKGTLHMGEYESEQVREKRYRALVAEIRRLSPDVIGINEANFLPDYAERLAKELDYDQIYHVGVAGLHLWRIGIPWNLKEGDAILAKKDLRLECAGRKQLSGGGFIWNNLSFHTEDATQVLVGKVQVNGEDVYIAVTHWHASPPDTDESREILSRLKKEWNYSDETHDEALRNLESDSRWRIDEAEKMAVYLNETVPTGKKLIVLGDFNAETGSPEMNRYLTRNFYDSYPAVSKDTGFTWDPVKNSNIRWFYLSDIKKRFDSLYEHLNTINEGRGRRIDYILFNNRFPDRPVKKSEVCCTAINGGVQPSDHFGVYSIISLK